ncbi:MAG: hypothetical protein J6A96_01035 [Clostridia bacterium]|nr:hypothetical protein [Clostridia bacterium]
MKRILIIFSMLCVIFSLFACAGENTESTNTTLSTEVTDMITDTKYILNGKVTKINDNSIEIQIENISDASGLFAVNISEITKIYDSFGNIINKDQINVNNNVEVSYNGQVTKSLPPQVNALAIQVK